MVMHARKNQRMNDGYFEKHQTHPYQNSKYTSSKSYGSSSDRYERIRDSPNGNYRSDSPDSQSPRDRDRSYQSKSFLQKIREKERENRDYKMSRDKYLDCARSPKEKRNRESDSRVNNDRNDEKTILHPIKSQNMSSRDRKPMHNNCVDKRDERDRVVRVGDWSEHVSSSGKKYYYNCKTEVSQWEKPREWVERERDRFRTRDRERERDRDTDRGYSSCSRSSMRHEKHSSIRTSNSNSSKDCSRENATSSRHWSSSSSRDDSDVPSKDSRSTHNKHPDESLHATQDMDISPGDSTPTSEVSYSNSSSQLQPEQNLVGPVLLATALPRLISHPLMPAAPGLLESSPQTTPTILPVSTAVTTSNAPGPPIVTMNSLPRLMSQSCASSDTADMNLHGNMGLAKSVELGNSAVHTSLSVDTNHSGPIVEGPPTPTHSESPDCSKVVTVPLNSPPTSNVSTLQGMSSSLQALRPQGPSITPSLANHYRDDLVGHVRGWPAEVLEKQAQKLAEEAHIMSSIQCSKVSAELKSARSIVRLTEIQATLQEQRILFLRQQIKELEELKSQNSFMSDDS